MLRISFSGAARAGKDTAVEIVQGILPDMGHIKFATKLHEVLRSMHGELGLGYSKDRELLQYIGVWGRKRDENIWVRPVVQLLQDNRDKSFCASDGRFINELMALRAAGFILTKIIRKDLPDAGAEWRKHESETALDSFTGWDYIVHNCGKRNHFEGNIELLLQMIKTKRHEMYPRTPTIID